MKSVAQNVLVLLLAMAFAGVGGWIARGQYQIDGVAWSRSRPPAPKRLVVRRSAPVARPVSADRAQLTPSVTAPEPLAPPDVLVAIADVAESTSPVGNRIELAALMPAPDAPRPIIIPVSGVATDALRDMFDEGRGNRRHEAIDILAPRGTPVVAADDGVVKKLFTSVAGGLTVYQFDPDDRFCYYYAHLDRYADDLHEGQLVRRGDILGYVGTTGNAPKDTPHLHFALIRLDPDKRWWKGTSVNPYPLLMAPPSR